VSSYQNIIKIEHLKHTYEINFILYSNTFKLFGFVKRSCVLFKNPATYLTLYKALIRAQLEYATPVWNPFYEKYSDHIESIQRKFLKMLNYKFFHKCSSYSTLLSKFSIPTLKVRRMYIDQMFLYKICSNRFDCNQLLNQIYYRIPSSSKRIRDNYMYKLFAPKLCRTKGGERAPLR